VQEVQRSWASSKYRPKKNYSSIVLISITHVWHLMREYIIQS